MNTTTIRITRKQAWPIVKLVFPDYTGRKFRLTFDTSFRFTNLNWSGGTKNEFAFVKSTGETANLTVWQAPWDTTIKAMEGLEVEIPLDVFIIEHSYFCGEDLGITIYAHKEIERTLAKHLIKQLAEQS